MGPEESNPAALVSVDTRPLPVVILAKSYRLLIVAAAALFFWLIIRAATPAGLTPAGQKALAAFVVCLIFWVTRVIPLAATSLLAIILIPILGVLSNSETFSLFGNQAVFFILGAFILAAALMKSGLSSRLALAFLRRFGGSAASLLAGALLVPAFLSFIMPEHAVAAMMFPIILEIVHGLKLKPIHDNYGQAIFLSMAWGAAIGGVATFLGGARNALAVGILKQSTGRFIGFFEWTIAILPLVLIMLVVTYVMIKKLFPTNISGVSRAIDLLEKKNKSLGRMSWQERLIGAIMLLTILAWIFLSGRYGLAIIAISAVVLLFLLQLVRWQDLEEYVNWGIILLYGGAITLGFALDKSGAASWLAKTAITSWAKSPFLVVAALALVSLLLTEGMSNAAVVAMLLPVGLGIGRQYGIDLRIMVFAVSIPAGLGFAFPMGNPPNAIAFSSGYINPRKMLAIGLALDVCAWLVFLLTSYFYWPLLNIKF